MSRILNLTSLVCLMSTGCVESRLADARFDVSAKFHGAAEAYVVAGRTFTQLANEMASRKHALQQEVTNEKWATWLGRHTDEDGRLVSRDSNGNIVPLSREDLIANLSIKEEHDSRLERSKNIWGKASFDWGAALDAFGIANVETLVTQTEIRRAEKEADDLMRRALTVLGSLAAGAMVVGL